MCMYSVYRPSRKVLVAKPNVNFSPTLASGALAVDKTCFSEGGGGLGGLHFNKGVGIVGVGCTNISEKSKPHSKILSRTQRGPNGIES